MIINKKYVLAGAIASATMLHTGMNTSFAAEYKIITGNSVNFRTGPSTNYSSIGKLNKGDKVEYLGDSGSWAKVKHDDKIGYVYGSYVEDYTSSTEIRYVTATSLNVRSGAGTGYSVIGKLTKGSKVEVISISNGWSKINYNGTTGYVSSSYLSSTNISNSNTSTSNSVSQVISMAKSLLGKPYVWGAEGPSSFDCSGFTYYIFKNAAGITLPRTSKEQSTYGTYVSRSNMQPGDLLFFDTNGNNDGDVSHVGIYLGNNQFIHSSSAKGKVIISEISSYYNGAYTNARRVL